MDNKEAIQELKSMKKSKESLTTTIFGGAYKVEVCALDMAIKALEKINWISVNERLPKEVGWVLVSREDGTVDLGHWFINEGWKEGHNSKIIAWQPLPEPYKI